jgi:hypothetical protein
VSHLFRDVARVLHRLVLTFNGPEGVPRTYDSTHTAARTRGSELVSSFAAALTESMSSSGCISCPDPIGPCPSCPSGQVCQQISQSCQTCAKRVCVSDSASSGKSGSGGPSTGATVGGAVGGVLGIAAVLAALYFFWWRPRGLAASRKRYSQHLAKQRNSRVAEKRKSAGAADSRDEAATGETDRATKRTSVHLNLGTPADSSSRISRRNTSPANGRQGGALVSGRTSEASFFFLRLPLNRNHTR